MSTIRPILVGVLLFAGIALATVPRHVRSIQSDIAQRTEAVLTQHGLAARVEVDGRDVTLIGDAAHPELQKQAHAVVEDLWGVRTVMDRLASPNDVQLASLSPPAGIEGSDHEPAQAPEPERPVANPPALRVNIELSVDRSLKLLGQAPSAAAKEAWLAAALSSTSRGEVRDRLEVVQTEGQDGFEAVVLEGLGLLQGLDEGRLSVTTDRLRISGRASDAGLEAKITQRLTEVLPNEYRLSVDVYTPRKPADVAAAAGGQVLRLMLVRSRDGSLILSGVAPSESVKSEWLTKAAEVYSSAMVQDRLLVRDITAPPGYGACMLTALPWVGKLTNGRAEVSPGGVRIFGKAQSVEDAEQLQAELSAAGCTVDVARLAVRSK